MAIYIPRTREEIKEVLAFPEALGPEIFYHMLRRGGDGNLTIWEPGEVGGEYIKAFGHYHRGKNKETYKVIYGRGLAFWQKRALNENNRPIDEEIAEAKIFPVKTGDVIEIPAGFGHLFINTGKTYLIALDNGPAEAGAFPRHADYEPLRRLHGFCYYVINNAGLPTLLKNPNYRRMPEIKLG